MNSEQTITVQWVDSEKEIPVNLWCKCFRPELEGRFWYACLEHCGIEDQFQFAYGLLYRGSEPIGIAPTFLMNVPVELIAPPLLVKLIRLVPLIGQLCPFLVCQKTLFVGSPCADEGTIGLVPGVTLTQVVPQLQDALQKRAAELKAPMIVWKDFSQSDCRQLKPLCASHGMFRVPSYPGTSLRILPGGMEEYYKNLKSSRRHNLKKKLRRSQALAALDVEIVQRPSQEVLDEIFALFWQTYEKGKTKFERLNIRFFQLIAEYDTSFFVLLRDRGNGKLLSFMLCFHLGERVINKFVGFDYSVAADIYLYARLWDAALAWVISTGVQEFQSGQTGYRSKIDLGNYLIPLTNFGKHSNSIINFVYAQIARTISWKTIDSDLEVHLKAHPDNDCSQREDACSGD